MKDNDDKYNFSESDKAVLAFLKIVDPEKHSMMMSLLKSQQKPKQTSNDDADKGLSKKFTLFAGIDVRFNEENKASEYKIWLWYLQNKAPPKK